MALRFPFLISSADSPWVLIPLAARKFKQASMFSIHPPVAGGKFPVSKEAGSQIDRKSVV